VIEDVSYLPYVGRINKKWGREDSESGGGEMAANRGAAHGQGTWNPKCDGWMNDVESDASIKFPTYFERFSLHDKD